MLDQAISTGKTVACTCYWTLWAAKATTAVAFSRLAALLVPGDRISHHGIYFYLLLTILVVCAFWLTAKICIACHLSKSWMLRNSVPHVAVT